MRISDWSSDVCSSDLFTTPNGHDAWVGWDPAEGWSTWDDPRTHFTADAPELVLDPGGHINPDTLDLDTFTELETEPDPPRLRLAPEPFDPTLQPCMPPPLRPLPLLRRTVRQLGRAHV